MNKYLKISSIIGIVSIFIYVVIHQKQQESTSETKVNDTSSEIVYTSKYKLDCSGNYEAYKKEDLTIEEETPSGKVILRYNDTDARFEYYCDRVIPYRYLEVVVRKYVLTYTCKELYVDCNESYQKINKPVVVEKKEVSADKPEEKDSVFVKYKPYNIIESKTTTNNNTAIKEEILSLKQIGTIDEYTKKNSVEKKTGRTIRYSDYKNKVSK